MVHYAPDDDIGLTSTVLWVNRVFRKKGKHNFFVKYLSRPNLAFILYLIIVSLYCRKSRTTRIYACPWNSHRRGCYVNVGCVRYDFKKKSKITIFGHKHFKYKFDHEKIQNLSTLVHACTYKNWNF